MIESVWPREFGAGAPLPQARSQQLAEAVAALQPGADGRVPGHGAGPVGRLLSALPEPAGSDTEFRAVLVTELSRRYLRAVRSAAHASPRVWRVVLERWVDGVAAPAAIALAGAHALVGYDLAPAVVSSCTILGRTPGRAERVVVQALVERIAALAAEVAAADAAARDAARGLALLCAGGEGWCQVERLWAVRGRPCESQRQRAGLDWRAALVAEALIDNWVPEYTPGTT